MRCVPPLCLLAALLACAQPLAAADAWGTLVREHCASCHSGDEPEGNLAFEPLAEGGLASAELPLLDRLHALLRTGAMPPPEEARPDAALLSEAIASIEAERHRRAAEAAHPGRVTMRRLNRTEYNCTIRDLLQLEDFRPADEFPADDVGYGFDNIGDVLTLPPALVERYLAAAEEIAQRAILAPETYQPPKTTLVGPEFMSLDGAQTGIEEDIHRLASFGELAHELEIPFEGRYELRVVASGDQAGDEPARMTVRLLSEGAELDLGAFDVPATRREPGEYRATVMLPAGRYSLRIAFVNDYYQPEAAETPGQQDRNLNLHSVACVGPLDITEASLPAAHRQLIVRQPSSDNADWDEIAREGLRPFARRAFRRPVSDEEVERLVAMTHLARENGESFARGMQWALVAALTSPHFLFHVERPAGAIEAGQREPLDDFALANRLSYLLWSSLPDEELLRLAEEGRLREPEALAVQARRLLADPRSATFISSFAEQWWQLRELWRLTPDPQRFPDFDDDLRKAMWEETRACFERVVRDDRSLLDLIDADYTFLNERLARHYGIEGITGPEFRLVSLADRRRGGLLGQASVLTVTSNPTRTSPVKRGKWVLEQLLGEGPPAPPAGVPPLAEDTTQKPLTGTLRQRMEQHRTDPSCAVCHQRMDAVGFGLENFDPIGAWRAADGGAAIDAAAELGAGQSFAGPIELKALLKADPEGFYRTSAQKLLTYALGRGLELHDRQAVEKITTAVAADGGRFSRLLSEVVTSEPFRYRVAEGGAP